VVIPKNGGRNCGNVAYHGGLAQNGGDEEGRTKCRVSKKHVGEAKNLKEPKLVFAEERSFCSGLLTKKGKKNQTSKRRRE